MTGAIHVALEPASRGLIGAAFVLVLVFILAGVPIIAALRGWGTDDAR